MLTDVAQYPIRGAGSSEIAASIEEGVERGLLPPGAALPSVRALARELAVAPATAAAAYRDLRERGVVVTFERSRTVVAHRPPLLTRPTTTLPPDVRDLANGSPDPALLPPLEQAARDLDLPVRLYGEEAALPELLSLAGRWFASDGIDASHLAVVGGALDGLERVLAAHLKVGDRVAVEDPGYTGMLDLARAMGLVPVPVEVDDDGPRAASLEAALASGVAALLVTPRAQNPLGAALTTDRAAVLGDLLAAHPDVLVVEDDHAGDVAGPPAVTLTTDRGRWAVVRSVCKSLGPDLRLAVLAGDRSTVTRVTGRQRLGTGWVSHVLQRLTIALWDADLASARETYAARRRALVEALADHGVRAHGRSGMNVWVPVPEEARVVAGLLQRGWAVQAGEVYRSATPPAIRVTVAALPVEDAPALAGDLADVLRPAGRTRPA